MKPSTYKEIKEALEKFKRNLPHLELLIETNHNKKEIENYVSYLIYLLYRINKKSTEKGKAELIQEVSNSLWWFESNKLENKEQRKFMPVEKLYNEWSKKYDTDSNLLIFLEEKVSNSFIGNVKNKEVLDYGCGTGRYAIKLAKQGARVTAIDFSSEMLKKAKIKANNQKVKIDFSKQDISKYSTNKKFDLIISMLVLDHIKNLKKVVGVIDKSSKIGTKLVISNVHPEMLRKDVDIKTGRAQGYLKEDRETNQYYHSLSEYVDLFLKKGFVLTRIENLIYDKKYYLNKKLFNRFKDFAGIKDKTIGIIMRFEKVK
jgi:2-polyprenyl-3-methyl-5-hydroxy-6-metoxy-1,4-benzoquinol methylase